MCPDQHASHATTDGLSRRRLLGSAALALVATGGAACSAPPSPGPTSSGPADPDREVVLAALTGELTLINAYDAAMRQNAGLTAELQSLRDEHAAHADALRSLVSVDNPARIPEIAVPGAPAGALAVLRRAEQDAAAARTLDCASAGRPDLARTLALIAASEAAHAAALGANPDAGPTTPVDPA